MSLNGPFLRGVVYAATVDHVDGEKYFLVVSNNGRNRALNNALTARLTTSRKPALDSIVELGHEDPLHGRILCDDLIQLWPDEVRTHLGALSPTTMAHVNAGLKAALGLP